LVAWKWLAVAAIELMARRLDERASTMNEMPHSPRKIRRLYVGLAVALVLALGVDLTWKFCQPSPPPAKRVRHVDFFAGHKTVLGMFKMDCGRYPTTEEGLNALITRPKDMPVHEWHGPYFDPPELPKDPWGHDYVYRCPGIHNPDGFDLFSCGPDGVSKTSGDDEDDFNNWNPESYMKARSWER
jgi:type II secretion system protein G